MSVRRVAVVAHRRKLDKVDAGTLRAALADHGFDEIDWRAIDKGSAATKAARKALDAGAEVVVACGGDGTVRATVDALAGSHVPLAVLPTGTANSFAAALSLPSRPEEVAAVIAAGATTRIDTGVCNDLAFALMGGTGFDALLIDAAEDHKERLGTLAYVRAAVRAARERDPFEVTVEVDGSPMFEGEATCVLVGNLGTLPGGMQAFPDSSPTDGLLDVGVVTAARLREWGSVLLSAARHRQRFNGHAHMTCGRDVRVKLHEKQRFELDGGTKGSAKKLHFSVRPSSLTVCVPSP